VLAADQRHDRPVPRQLGDRRAPAPAVHVDRRHAVRDYAHLAARALAEGRRDRLRHRHDLGRRRGDDPRKRAIPGEVVLEPDHRDPRAGAREPGDERRLDPVRVDDVGTQPLELAP
jgi:hypothetical protein